MKLEASIRAADLATAIMLLRIGENVNLRDSDGLTPLMIASGLGQPQMVELLLTAGAEVLLVEPRMGATALHKAAQSGNVDVIKLLLDHGSFLDIQSATLGHTPLMDAVLYKQQSAVRLLLNRGAKTKLTNHYQQTAIDLALGDNLEEIVKLIDAAEEARASEVRAQTLTAAVKAGDRASVLRIVKAGAALDERLPMMGNFDDDYTALGIAARDGHTDIVNILLDAGADPRQVNGLMRATPAHEAAYMGHADVARALTKKRDRAGAPALEIDAQGPYNGLTALHDAVWHGHLDTAQVLVEAGARLDLRSHTGLTSRELAVLYGYTDLAHLISAEKTTETLA